jgi:tetratricopeptide (TPR) repeat protein
MNKISLMAAMLLVGASATAQTSVLKEAEAAMKSNKAYTEVEKIAKPAMANGETKNMAQTYYFPGKAAFKQYDEQLGKKQLGIIKAGSTEAVAMGDALIAGYNYYVIALPLDSVADAKGRIKTKYSKEMLSTLEGHYNDFNAVGVDFFNAQNFDKAYEAWDIYVNMPEKFQFSKGFKANPDSIVSMTMYNQALAAWNMQDYAKAVKASRNAINHGYDNKGIFDIAVAAAQNAKDDESLLEFATVGNKKYGREDSQFINQIINYYLNKEQYDAALNFLNEGLKENPNNSQYYALEGIIYDNKGDMDNAKRCYLKAISLDADNSIANLYYGRLIASEAGKLADNFDEKTGGNFAVYKKKNLDPLYEEAAKYIEHAVAVDKNQRTTGYKLLDVIYYNLGDERYNQLQQRKQEDVD